MSVELDHIAKRYEKRKQNPTGRYSRFNPEVMASLQERQRAMVSLLKANSFMSLDEADVLEIGCGAGSNLQELILMGASPARLVGNELLQDRVAAARMALPGALRLLSGDASALPIGPAEFDIVYQSTMFSSILDNALQDRIAQSMWRWVRPGGGILWYDFIYNNPSNQDVRGVPIKRIRELFPEGDVQVRRVTLAPPISRRVCRIHPLLYPVFNSLPFLRTHVLCWVAKHKEQ